MVGYIQLEASANGLYALDIDALYYVPLSSFLTVMIQILVESNNVI